jgi:hypothetical protein
MFLISASSSRGRNVYVQFSSHQELTTMDQNTQGRGDEVGTLYSNILKTKCCYIVDSNTLQSI